MTINPSKKTILITGATGYLGSAILKAVSIKNDHNIIILKRSFSNIFRIKEYTKSVLMYNIDEVPIEKVFDENHIDIILHCATDYGRKSVNPMQIIEANLLLPVKLIECGREHGVKAFINTDTILDKGINHYSLSKKQFRDWLMSYKSGMACVNVELGHFYGPGDDTTKFISYIFDLLVKNTPSIDLTKGEQIRDFLYIDDVVSAFLKIIYHTEKLKNGFIDFQVCGGYTISIKDLVVLIKKMTNNTLTELRFGVLPYRENEVMKFKANMKLIKSLGWAAKYPIKEGLVKMIEQESLIRKKI